jgi:hypothetical protein
MILSFHVGDVGVRSAVRSMCRRPRPREIDGLRSVETGICAPFDGKSRPSPKRLALIAAWDDDAALDRFLDDSRLADTLADGWRVRLAPLQASEGPWSAIPGLGEPVVETDEDAPVAVITLGRLKLRRVVPFFRANSGAEKLLALQSAVLFATGIARPPRFVATFSLWRTAREMKDYAYGRAGRGHLAAIEAHKREPFHHESIFARFRPYAAEGRIDGREPLAARANT